MSLTKLFNGMSAEDKQALHDLRAEELAAGRDWKLSDLLRALTPDDQLLT